MTGIRPDMFYGLPGQGMSLPQWLIDPITDDEMAMRYPGTFGDPISSSEVPMVPKPQPSLDWRTRLFGGADPLGVLNQQQAAGAGRQALRDFGISLLQNSGPSPFRRGTGELLGTALGAGQQSFQQGVQSVAQRLQQAREMAIKEQNANTQAAFAQRQIAGSMPRPANLQQFSSRGLLWQRNQQTGEVQPVLDANGTQLPAPTLDPNSPEAIRAAGKRAYATARGSREGSGPSLGVVQAHQNTATQVQVIDDALEQLQQNPDAVGWLNAIVPDVAMQYLDPDGNPLRMAVADIGSLKIRDRSGAAVTVSEAPRLAPWVPLTTDTPQRAAQKLTRLRELILEEQDAYLRNFPQLQTEADDGYPR